MKGSDTVFTRKTFPKQAYQPSRPVASWHSTSRRSKNAAPEPQHKQARQKEKREITLTPGVFFDGTGKWSEPE
ncbi:hypothetical protein BN434_pEA290003 (plasmid) [Erwinia amylovora CFBP 2585]|nr:hypothetical protein BN434_pEA290003 [Erwinia amylovora CFBP 2585]